MGLQHKYSARTVRQVRVYETPLSHVFIHMWESCSRVCRGNRGTTRHTPHGRRHLLNPFPPSEKAQGSGRTRPSLVQVVRLEG